MVLRKKRNPVGLKPQRFLMLSTIYKNLSRPRKNSKRAVERTCESSRAYKGKGKALLEASPKPVEAKRSEPSASVLSKEGEQESDVSTETDYDSDEFTLATIKRKKKAVGKRTVKSSRAYEGKGKKTTSAAAPRNVRAKRTKPISEVLKKTRTATATSSPCGKENTSATCEGSPSSDIMMAVHTLLSLSNGGVPSAAGSGLPQYMQSEYGRCVMNSNPAEFGIEKAEEYMREA